MAQLAPIEAAWARYYAAGGTARAQAGGPVNVHFAAIGGIAAPVTAVLVPLEERVRRLPQTEQPSRSFPVVSVGLAMLVSIALRARFVITPLTSDEGGYLAVARAWARGRHLYTDAWVDRPQGLMVLFRVWDAVTGGSGPAIRVMAMLFGCLAVAGIGYAAFCLAGARAAVLAAFLTAVASSNARIEGFIANGELLAGGVATVSIGLACAYLTRGRTMWWLFASGIASGVAISLKQSGADGMLAIVTCLGFGLVTRERAARTVVRELASFLAGFGVIVALLVAHGALLGIGDWWYAVAGYRLDGTNGATRADWHKFRTTALIASPTIIPLAAAVAVGLFARRPRAHRLSRTSLLVPAWIVFACVVFYAGGLFHRHYWVGLTFPLALAAGLSLSRVSSRAAAAVIAVIVAIPSVGSTVQLAVMDRADATAHASGDPRSTTNVAVANWWHEHRRPGDTVYVMCASAAFYAYADAIPPYRYLWQDGVIHARSAQQRLLAMFAGDAAPSYVVMYQSMASCNPNGQLAPLIHARYQQVGVVDGRQILHLAHPPPPQPAGGYG